MQEEAFAGLARQTWGSWDPQAAMAGMREEWVPQQTRCIVVDGVLAGWVRLEPREGYDWLDLIVIGAGFRGQGLGGAVLGVLIAQAQQRGVPLWLSVYRNNTARKLYARMGFCTVARDPVRVLMGHGALEPPAALLQERTVP